MPKRLSIVCLLAAWLCASGAVLDGVQVYAWGRMFLRYTHGMSVAQAAAETMDGSKPCPLCLAVRRAREQSEHQQPVSASGTDAAKLILIADEAPPLVLAREMETWPIVVLGQPPSRRDAVPVPPPRVSAAGLAV
ncbi:MAG TPA: hypothetical protein VHE61_04535 [Opitutaceae bacterium]|nr:hypothetical protein [Opitutaceae bacterium]